MDGPVLHAGMWLLTEIGANLAGANSVTQLLLLSCDTASKGMWASSLCPDNCLGVADEKDSSTTVAAFLHWSLSATFGTRMERLPFHFAYPLRQLKCRFQFIDSVMLNDGS